MPVNSEAIGKVARTREPLIKQVFLVDDPNGENDDLKKLNFAKRVSSLFPFTGNLTQSVNFWSLLLNILVFFSTKTCYTCNARKKP